MAKGKNPRREKKTKSSLSANFKRERVVTRSQDRAVGEATRRVALRELEAAAKKLAKERAEALSNEPAKARGNRNDGQLHLAFVRMGQGDCTIITTPKGRTIMIDCGSAAKERSSTKAHSSGMDTSADESSDDNAAYLKKIRDTIYGPKFLKSSTALDVLILTHPDTDHYNQLQSVLDDDTSIKSIYHSAKLVKYSVGQHSAWLKTHIDSEAHIYAVTVNKTKGKIKQIINDQPVATMDSTTKINRVDTNGAIRIVDEEKCKISILASNVAAEQKATKRDKGTDINRGSVVTLIEAFNKKIVICGDATSTTEKFLVGQYPTLLAGVNLLQVPHHGSAVTSSTDLLVDTLKPKMAIISAGKQVRKDHLPSFDTIGKYLAHQTNEKAHKHEIFYWMKGNRGSFFAQSSFYEKPIFVTGSNETQELVFSG